MFKNIQDKLLISNPLLWNLKIVPFAVIALFFHLIFFIIGYGNGEVTFADDYYSYYDYGYDTGIVIFFSVIVSILIAIVWLVLYSRNNAFKSFYPKSNFSLFKEFLYILLFCSLFSSFTLTYLMASDFRTRNYYSEQEIAKKLEILSLSSAFLDGSFVESNYVSVQVDGQYTNKQRTDFQYRDRTYSLNSLMNKRVETDSYYIKSSDSVMNSRVKNWLYENRKDSVKWVFNEVMKMTKEHNLQTNITAEKWLSLVYNYPKFEDYTIVNKSKAQESHPYETVPYADSTTAVVVETVEPARQTSSYYVPYEPLTDSYRKIAKAHQHPSIDSEALYFYLYFAISLALAIFSFKVTSGRNWMIALVSLGVVSLIVGIISAFSNGKAFFVFYLLIFFGLLIHFFATVSSRSGKGISGITLNQILWLMPSFIPTLYFCILEIAKDSSNYYYAYSVENVNGQEFPETFPKIDWMEAHLPEMMIINIGLVILFIFLFSVQIKKWKGIAED